MTRIQRDPTLIVRHELLRLPHALVVERMGREAIDQDNDRLRHLRVLRHSRISGRQPVQVPRSRPITRTRPTNVVDMAAPRALRTPPTDPPRTAPGAGHNAAPIIKAGRCIALRKRCEKHVEPADPVGGNQRTETWIYFIRRLYTMAVCVLCIVPITVSVGKPADVGAR